jgi:pyruvate dehydrogenase E2 component (dihydrolipoamide acetyltransferase)
MATPIQMPNLSPTMKEGKITRWIKKVGDQVSSGDAIAELETDKSNLEIEAYDDGVLLAIFVGENESAPVGDVIAYIGKKGEKVEQPPKGGPAPSAPASGQVANPDRQMEQPLQKPEPQAPKQQPPVVTQAPPAAHPEATRKAQAPVSKPSVQQPAAPLGEGGRVRASPLAKKIAREQGLDLTAVSGTGPGGRIIRKDVEAAISAGPAAARAAAAPAAAKKPAFVPVPVHGERKEPTATPLSSMRKVISQRMAEVKPGVPHFYLSVDIEMDAAMKIREEAKALEAKVSVNDIIVKAMGIALRRIPKMNVSLQGDQILQFQNADVGIAVSIEDGLITPVLQDADLKGLASLAAEARELAERARRRALKPAEYSGGAITLSNLGMFGMDAFIAVINPPQSAILAVGAVADKAVVRDGQLVVRKVMTATLSCDHRVIDGALGAQYLSEVKSLLEHPMRLLF